MNPDLEKFIDRLAVFFEEQGASRSAGQILAWLLISERPQSLDDLARGLQLSKAAASLGTRLWENNGLIERVRYRGDRKVYYQLRPNVAQALAEAAFEKFSRMVDILEEGHRTLDEADHPAGRARLAEFARVYRRLAQALPGLLQELGEG